MSMNHVPLTAAKLASRDTLSHSEMVAYTYCKQAHFFRYEKRLIPREEKENLTLWLAINRGLSVWYDSFNKTKALTTVEESLQGSDFKSRLLPLISGMLEGYIEHWKQRDTFKVLQIDLPYITPIITPSGRASRIQDLAGVVPLVIEKPDGSVWIVIHRSIAKKDPSLSERLECDIRIRAACWALNRYLISGVSGVIVNVLRAKLPVEPEILKNGTISKRSNIDTTLEVFAAALNRTSSNNHADYSAILDRLAAEDNSFFTRWERAYSPGEMERIGQELYLISRDMRRASRELPYGNSNSCTSYGLCPYLDLCAGRLDPDAVETNFRKLDTRHPALADVNIDSLRLSTRPKRKYGSNNVPRAYTDLVQ